MKKILIYLPVIVIFLTLFNCKKQYDKDVIGNINLTISLEKKKIIKDSLNIMTFIIHNKSREKIAINENDAKLMLTSSLTGNTETTHINVIESKSPDKIKSNKKLELKGGESITRNIDLSKIIYTNEDLSSCGEYSVMLVMESPKKLKNNQCETFIKSNVLELEIM